MEQERNERRIYLKDLIFTALYRWKWLVIVAVVCALALGGLEYFSSGSVTLGGISITPENQIKIEQLQDTIQVHEKMIQDHAAYLEQSIMMQLDSYAAYTAVASYFVISETESDQAEKIDEAILQHYAQVAREQATVEAAAEALQLESWMVGELISVTNAQNTGLSVVARGRTPEEAANILAAVCGEIDGQQTATAEQMGAHQLTKTSYTSGPKVDSGLFEAQYGTRQRLTTMKNNLVAAKAELDRMLPTELTGGTKKVVLFAAVGAVLGVCLVVCVAWVYHISDEKVYSARVLTDRTGLRILGCVSDGRKRDKVTLWLRKLEGRTPDTQMDAAAVNICNRWENGKKLLLLGDFETEKIQPLQEKLEAAGIRCTLGSALETSAAALELLAQCDGVVLVETCGRSRYDRVLWQLETAKDYGKELLGCVVIGG